MSLSVSLFVLLALFAPTLLPGGAKQGWAGELLQRVNPMTAAEHYIRNVVINQYDWTTRAVVADVTDRRERRAHDASRCS